MFYQNMDFKKYFFFFEFPLIIGYEINMSNSCVIYAWRWYLLQMLVFWGFIYPVIVRFFWGGLFFL